MHESKRERYIRIIKDKLEDDFMAICHELHFTEEAVKELLWLLEDKDKEAEWIRTGEVNEGAFGIKYREIKCSKCGYTTDFAPSEYCKKCGSHMKVEDGK